MYSGSDMLIIIQAYLLLGCFVDLVSPLTVADRNLASPYIYMYYTARILSVYEVYMRSCRIFVINSSSWYRRELYLGSMMVVGRDRPIEALCNWSLRVLIIHRGGLNTFEYQGPVFLIWL